MKTLIAAVVLMTLTRVAAADGEATPLFGGALTYTAAEDRQVELVGGQLELAWWPGRFGLAVEASAGRSVTDDNVRNLAVAGSARFLLTTWLWPALFDPRNVEMGIELHAVAERRWWSQDDRVDALGLGAAIRMRGGSDWELSSLIAESRLFVRVMRSRDAVSDVVARTAGMAPRTDRDGVIVTIGLGAAFGAGRQRYLERFRLNAEPAVAGGAP